jgi:hypothetical protein
MFNDNPQPPGSYVVQLYPGEAALAELNRRRSSDGQDHVSFARNTGEAGDHTVITGYGTFHYDASVGELSRATSFYQEMLEEDGRRYCETESRRKFPSP